jgi:hypothetical protein
MFRLLDGEPGAQLCPYAWWCSSTGATQGVNNTAARRYRAGANVDGNMFSATFSQNTIQSVSEGTWFGFRARGGIGLAKDQYTTYAALNMVDNTTAATSIWRQDPGVNWLVGSDPNSPQPKLSGPLHLGQLVNQSERVWGGRVKRLRHVVDGGLLDTHDNGTKLQLSGDAGSYIYTMWDPNVVPVAS